MLSNRRYAKGRTRPGVMNRTETAFSQNLEALQRTGSIKRFWFEPARLVLVPGGKLSYTPDFMVQGADDVISFVEVKGAKVLITDDAKVKYKVAADRFPFRFVLTYPERPGWAFFLLPEAKRIGGLLSDD